MRAIMRCVFAVLVVPLVALAQSVSPPPQPLHLVGDHWTPYDPPTEFPDGVTVHIIERGDTLWDLARKHLGDPYLWPQIWESNPYITDSHWIYPGDPLVIEVTVQEAEGVPVDEEVVSDAEDVVSEYDVEEIPVDDLPYDDLEVAEKVDEAVPFPLGSSADVYCFARLVEDEGVFPYSIIGAERIDTQGDFSEGDVVYVDGGAASGVRAGDRFFIFRRGDVLRHPVSDARMGVVYEQVGRLKVLCAQEESSICEITAACDMITIGDQLQPYQPIPVPLVIEPPSSDRCDEPNGKPTGYLVFFKDGILEGAASTLAFVDLGANEGIYPGQFATIFKDNEVKGFPRIVLGELGFLTVHENYSTVRVTRSWTSVHVADRIELK